MDFVASWSNPAVAEGAKRNLCLSNNCDFLLPHPDLLRVGKQTRRVRFIRAVAKIATGSILPFEGKEPCYVTDCGLGARDTVLSQFDGEGH